MRTSVPVAAGLAFALTVSFSPVVLVAARRRRIFDVPNARSSHRVATPRIGGLAPAVGASVAFFAAASITGPARGLLLAGVAFAAIGLWDDLRTAAPLWRFGMQVVAGATVLPLLLADLGGSVLWQGAFGLVALVWLVGYVNAFNFMDGINGIAACQAIVVGSMWCALGLARDEPLLAAGGAVAAAAAAGFLPFNLPEARAFPGDVGSYFLGAWLAVLAVVAVRSGLPIEAVLAPMALYCADTASTLLRRMRRQERWYEAHREHAYQRYTDAGWSHARTTLVVSGATAASCVLGIVSLTGALVPRVAAAAAVLGIVALYLAGPSFVVRPQAAVA